jgi:hypothetical protein
MWKDVWLRVADIERRSLQLHRPPEDQRAQLLVGEWTQVAEAQTSDRVTGNVLIEQVARLL